MMGFGSYAGNVHGGGSSNLSALAPPFTVDRSNPKPAVTPLVDLGEPLNWLDTNPYTYNSPQPAKLPQLDLDPIPNPSYDQNSDLFDHKTYYPSYVSPSIHVSTFNEQSLSGLDHAAQWGSGLWDWEKGKPAQLGGGFYSEEPNVVPPSIYTDHINLGANPSKSLKTCEEPLQNIYSLGREKQAEPVSMENLDYDPFLGQNPSFMPGDFLKTSIIGSSQAFTETNLQVPPLTMANCKNNQLPFITPYEKPLRHHVTTPSDSVPALKSSPRIVIRPPVVGTSSSGSNSVLVQNANPGINATITNLTGSNPSIAKEPRFLSNFGRKNEFDPSLISFHLNGNSYLSGESSSTSTERLTTTNMATKDASDNLFIAKSGLNFSHISTGKFSSGLDNNEPVTALESALETSDYCNPPVDSPCWKGAPASHNSPFGSSGSVTMQPAKKLEAADCSNGQALKFISMNTANMVKHPSGKPGEILMSDEIGNVEDGSISYLKLPSVSMPYFGDEIGNVEDGSISYLKLPSVSMPSFREHQPDNAGKAGSYQKKANCTYEIKISDDASEGKKDYCLFDESVDEVEKASHTTHTSLAESRSTSKNLCTSETCVADLDMKDNDVSGWGSSHSLRCAAKVFSSSPYFMKDISTERAKVLDREPVSNSSISVLVNTMHNLSELLLYHCSNEACEIKEQDLKSLEEVLNNIGTCMSKNIGQESLLSELHMKPHGTSAETPQVAAINVLSQHAQEKRKHSGKKDEKCPDFVSVKSGTDIKVKNDKMTQAIKKVLIENFHENEEPHPQVLLYKNLWLEAEAALCSINFMARYNNMKIEIEKCKLDSEKEMSEDTPDEDKILRSRLSAEINIDENLTVVAEGSPNLSNRNSPIASSSNHADDATARFQILNRRLNNSNSPDSRVVDGILNSKVSLDSDNVDKLAAEVKDSSTPGLRMHESPALGTACHADAVEASIMARFHILKNRGTNDLDSSDMEQKQLPEAVDLVAAGKSKQILIDGDTAEDGISSFNLGSVSQQQVANHAGEQVLLKNFHPCIKHDCMLQPPGPGNTTLGNELSAGWYDSCSSDWEHV